MSDYRYLDQVTDACLVLNVNQEVVYYNQSFLILGNLKEREVKKLKFTELISIAEWPKDELSVESEFHFFNGTSGFAQIKKIQLQPDCFLIVLNDLTIEKQLHVKFQNQLIELKNLNQNLESLVELRTGQLSRVNKYLSGILGSFKQAIFTVDRSGIIDLGNGVNLEMMGSQAPAHLNDLFAQEMNPASVQSWVDFVFSGTMSFEELAPLIPSEIKWGEVPYRVDCYPFAQEGRDVHSIIIALTNISHELSIREDISNKETLASSLLKASQSARWYGHFLDECKNIFRVITDPNCEEKVALPLLHALKGLFSYYGPVTLDLKIHEVESMAGEWVLRQERIRLIEKKFDEISQKILDLFPHFKSTSQILSQKELNLLGECQSTDEVRKLLLPHLAIHLPSFCQGLKDYTSEIALSVSKELHRFLVTGDEMYLNLKILGLINQFLIQGLRNSVAHVFSENSSENSPNMIEINFSLQDVFVILSLKSFGAFSERENHKDLLSGQKQGMRLIDQLAKSLNCKIELDVTKEKGYSDFRLIIPQDFIAKA